MSKYHNPTPCQATVTDCRQSNKQTKTHATRTVTRQWTQAHSVFKIRQGSRNDVLCPQSLHTAFDVDVPNTEMK